MATDFSCFPVGAAGFYQGGAGISGKWLPRERPAGQSRMIEKERDGMLFGVVLVILTLLSGINACG